MRTAVARSLSGAILVTLLCPALAIGLCQAKLPSDSEMERKFKEAIAAEDGGNLDRAVSILSKLHDAHPGVFAVDESLGLLYAQRADYVQALPLLKAAAAEQPSSDAAHANLGAALYNVHRNDEAVIEFKHAVGINPGNESALKSLGRVLMDEHREAEAAMDLSAALHLAPDDGELQLDCATALLAAKRVAEARKILSAFTDADDSARAQALMGEADEAEKDFSSAERHFTRAEELEPNEENAWLVGEEFLQHWTFDAASIEFAAASAKFPGSTRLRLGLGAALFGDQKYAQAIPVFAGLLDGDRDNAQYASMLGISCSAVMQSAPPECAGLTRYAEDHKADARASAYAAAFLLRQHDPQAQRPHAQQLLEASLAADPQLPEAQFQMGTFLQDDGSWKESIPYLERAIKLKPDFSKAHYRLSLAYWRTGRKPEAEIQMELQQQFSKQEQEDLDRRLRQITTFVVQAHN